MSEMVLAQLAALKTMATADLKAQWRKLNDSETAALQQALSGEPTGLSHPGAGPSADLSRRR